MSVYDLFRINCILFTEFKKIDVIFSITTITKLKTKNKTMPCVTKTAFARLLRDVKRTAKKRIAKAKAEEREKRIMIKIRGQLLKELKKVQKKKCKVSIEIVKPNHSTMYYRRNRIVASRVLKCPHEGCKYTTVYSKQNIRNHIYAKHTSKEDRPFKCNQDGCNKRYAQKANLNIHIKKNHNTGVNPNQSETSSKPQTLTELVTMSLSQIA